jgi:hypothetical protein
MATAGSAKKTAKKHTPIVVNVDTTKKRTKTLARTAYSKENPSPHAFKPGESGNPGGKPRNVDQLLSKTLRVALCDRAPDEVAEGFHLPRGASWAQCLTRRLLIMAVRGDLQAMREIREATEGLKVHASLDVPDPNIPPPLFELVFIESNGDGRPASGITIEAESATPPPALPAAT